MVVWRRISPFWLACLVILVGAASASAALEAATPRVVTNSTGGQNQDASIDRSGKWVLFRSNVNQTTGVTDPGIGTFDFDNSGAGFTPPGATPPDPSCPSCLGINFGSHSNLYLWQMKKKAGVPANSVRQLTFSLSGGVDANESPDMDARAQYGVWSSDQTQYIGNPDGNREIFLVELKTGAISEITDTTGGGNTANREPCISDGGKVVVFDSNRDFAGANCTLGDGVTPCSNADGNSEIMVWDRASGAFTQVTATTAGLGTANIRARISNDGRYLVFQSTRDFSGVLPGGTVCTQLDGVSACANDGNAEIYRYDRKDNLLMQLTDTVNGAGCGGASANERAEISKRGRWITFQSKCEAQLNPTGCGDCNGNDEVFLVNPKKAAIQQVTISDGGFNRVPRISGAGNYIVFESNRAYLSGNGTHSKVLYVLRRNDRKPRPGLSGAGQLVEDATLAGQGIAQSPQAKLTLIGVSGGFSSSIENFGVSTNGRYIAFDNSKGVGNQEIWWADRKK